MTTVKAYAVICTANLSEAKKWYVKLFGRDPDRTPMPQVHEWYFGDGGVQLVDEAQSAGHTKLTLIVSSLDKTRAELEERGLTIGTASRGDFAVFAQIKDPDSNTVTIAQPGPAT